MKYTAKTFQYLKKSFWLIGLLSLPAAIVLGFFAKPMSSVTFIPNYISSEINSFGDMFYLMSNGNSFKYIYPMFLIFFTLLASVSAILSVIEKHFRTGKLAIKKPLSEINNNLIPVLKIILVLTLVMIVCTLLSVALDTLAHYLIAGWGKPNIASMIVVMLISIFFFILFFSLFAPLVFMIPKMSIFGLSFYDSLTAAYDIVSNNKFKIIFGGILPFMIVAFIEFLISFFNVPKFVSVIYSTLFYAFIISYVCSYFMIIIFETSNLERRDLKKYY